MSKEFRRVFKDLPESKGGESELTGANKVKVDKSVGMKRNLDYLKESLRPVLQGKAVIDQRPARVGGFKSIDKEVKLLRR